MNKCFKNQLITLAFAASVFVMPLGAQASAYNRAQLDKIAAPIALYPDTLLGSVLVASTYPDQVIDAYNWTVSYQALTQGQKESLIASQPWDDSVKTLALIPETLEMMAGDMAWTDSLSQAFVTQQDSLCESIQGLRRRAKMNGALKDGNYIRVVDSGNYIVINSADSACTAVPVYSAAVYNYSPAQVVLNTVLSWTTVRILDSLFYGGRWDWRHHEVYMSRGHHYHVPHSVVPPYRPQLHLPVRHVAHRPLPPRPAPAAHRPLPPCPTPVAHRPEVHKPAPAAHRPEVKKPAPIAHRPEAHKPAPAAHRPEVHKPAPAAHRPSPGKGRTHDAGRGEKKHKH